MSAHGGDALGTHEKTNGVVAQWSFNVHPEKKRTDGGSEQRLLLLRQQFGEKETEGCCR